MICVAKVTARVKWKAKVSNFQQGMAMKLGIALALALVGGAAAAAGKAHEARRVDGRPLVKVGEGTRVRDGQKLYEMELWLDEQDARRAFPALVMRAGGHDHARLTRGEHAPAFVVWGHFTKQAVLTFARAVPAATMRRDVGGELGDVKGADALLALFVDAKAGDRWVLTTGDNGQIALDLDGAKKKGPESPKLVRALWEVWLGKRPLSTELRQSLVEHIDVLAP